MFISWDALGAIGEFVGAAAVVILAVQIKNQSRESHSLAVHQIQEAFRRAITAFNDAEQADVYVKALSNFDDLNESQRLQFFSMVQGLLRVWEEAYYQFVNKRLDQHVWNAMVAHVCDLIGTDGYKRVWDMRKHTYSSDFRDFVETLEPGEYKLY